MKTLYLDIFSGISGDMFIAAMIDLGVKPESLESELRKLKLEGYHLHVERKQKSGIDGVKFDVHLEGEHDHDGHHHHAHDHGHSHTHGHSHSKSILTMIFGPGEHSHEHEHGHSHEHTRDFSQIKQLINESGLSQWVKEKSLAVFQRIAVAEGKIHGKPPEQVHFHEVGAIDSIVDIVGAAVALELLGRPRVLASNVVEGTGFVKCAHGRFPVPTPATLAILGARGVAISQCEEPHELITPTGAALLAEFVEEFGPMQNLVAEKIGFGLGTRDNKTRPNVVRAVLGNGSGATGQVSGENTALQHVTPGTSHSAPALDWETDRIAVLETNLDDVSSEILGSFVENALAGGALDVFHTPIQMKKSRPGVLLTVLCTEADADRFSELLLRETSAFGVRRTVAERRKLQREFTTIKTDFGDVTVKLGKLNGKVIQAAPEFESCRKIAEQAKVPIKQVYDAAIRAANH
jgi:pyridinium-3,5-bisthiocarboxylic acid mononucleotide nickel chelatase